MINFSKLTLGTVQFGLDYGINNQAGKPNESEVFKILDFAYENGIKSLDTADAYGTSQEVIGNFHRIRNFKFEILSKFKNENSLNINSSVIKLLDNLEISQLEVLSFHSYADFKNSHSIIKKLTELKIEGKIKKTGISVYTNHEFADVINNKNIDVIQIPYNILDNSNIKGELIQSAKKMNKEIHVRSVFLQGLFFMDFNKFPSKLIPLYNYISIIKQYCNDNNISIGTMALNYVFMNKHIDKIIIGVDNLSQLKYNLSLISNNQEIFEFINNNIFVKEINLLNPTNWK